MILPQLSAQEIREKRVLLRLDLDVTNDTSRIEAAKATLNFLVKNSAKTIIIGHKGRPNGVKDDNLSLKGLIPVLSSLAGKEVVFEGEGRVVLKENLRFDPGEETNDEGFARQLADLADFYVNEAFAVSHRAHASIVGVPKYLPHAAGFRFAAEIENLNKILENPRKPVVVIISGIKEDKVALAKLLSQKVDKVLVGGRLPEFFGDNTDSIRTQPNGKLVIANLIMDKEDITLNSIEKFKSEIVKAGTLVLAGVLGRYEDEGHRQGTKEIFTAVAYAKAYKVAGGGDTEAALTIFNLTGKFDWISVGGGAMLEFLAKQTLPGLEALIS